MTLTLEAAPHAIHRVDARDHVATALRDLLSGERVAAPDGPIKVRDEIPTGHKIAIRPIGEGEEVLKFGWPIGRATRAIAAGEHVHVQNVATLLDGVETYEFRPAAGEEEATVAPPRTFLGYRRESGRVGTRNEIWILCTVGCVGATARRLAELANARFAGRVDGIHAFPHPYGCSQLGDDLAHTRQMLAALAQHPNAGGVLIVGLGCENNQLGALLAEATDLAPDRVRSFTTQMVADEYETGLAMIEELVARAEQDRREPVPLSELVIGLKCGGSDGFSGVTANPLVGRVADAVAAAGGTPVLTEIPEIFGAERILMARARDEDVFEKIRSVVDDFKGYFIAHGQPIYENPSPGNKAGGITTLDEKSLGAVQKAGRSTVVEVLRYGQRVGAHGLTLLEAPGNDAVSSTALTAAGATVILFTTGRGTPMGFPAPTLKIASNSALAERKPNWIDFDAGTLLAGESAEDATGRLLDLVVATASGAPTRSERNGEREIALWKQGVTV
ncbi:altronate dehydratase family protein [Sphingomonas cannabina]|uniref:UxaA family hydrolase n=1 Tax=Sphingomonas cannabina TaxID=2899123 RepID=UPI001F42A041|nr:altronate dehydratase family protein [Sphingomonas cannabina]UIJ45512.1 altronate dehydratase family protein [Sphingomonas cannabina]